MLSFQSFSLFSLLSLLISYLRIKLQCVLFKKSTLCNFRVFISKNWSLLHYILCHLPTKMWRAKLTKSFKKLPLFLMSFRTVCCLICVEKKLLLQSSAWGVYCSCSPSFKWFLTKLHADCKKMVSEAKKTISRTLCYNIITSGQKNHSGKQQNFFPRKI